MLELALNSGLPLIKVVTDDLINLPEVLARLAGDEVHPIKPNEIIGLKSKVMSRVCYMLDSEGLDYVQAYKSCVEHDKVLVIVNPEDDNPAMYDAGMLKLPPDMLVEFLEEIVDEDAIEHFVAALGGLSLKDVAEVCRLCMTQNESLTPRGVMSIRRMYMSNLRGVQQVDTNYGFYVPEERLEKWVKINSPIFKRHDLPPELIPRGMLLDGDPGTGKTMAAKYLANRLEIPLFRLELGGLMDKYVGQSEGNLKTALSQVDAAEPCVLLIDEVEKVFKATDDGGVTTRLLAQLLWWLQEHRSRVLTVMTTNEKEALPEELYRPGRIDLVFVLRGLNSLHAINFTKELLDDLLGKLPKQPVKVEKNMRDFSLSRVKQYFTKDVTAITPSRISQMVFSEVKHRLK